MLSPSISSFFRPKILFGADTKINLLSYISISGVISSKTKIVPFLNNSSVFSFAIKANVFSLKIFWDEIGVY